MRRLRSLDRLCKGAWWDQGSILGVKGGRDEYTICRGAPGALVWNRKTWGEDDDTHAR